MAATLTTIPTPDFLPSDPTAPSTFLSLASPTVRVSKLSEGGTSLLRPIAHAHNSGIYPHSSGTDSIPISKGIFAPCVPPPDVLAAYERCIRNEGTRTDVEIWAKFHEVHHEILLKYTDPRAQVWKHPFELFNPPRKAWEAYERLKLGIGNSGDRELVDMFAAKKAYYGEGVGQYMIVSRRYKVRRSRHSAKLAKQRRMKGELESRPTKTESEH